MSTLAARLTSLDYKAAITLVLIFVDFVSRILITNFVQPIYFDSLVTLAVGYWFGTSEKKAAGLQRATG